MMVNDDGDDAVGPPVFLLSIVFCFNLSSLHTSSL